MYQLAVTAARRYQAAHHADTCRRQMQNQKFFPVGQLQCHHIARAQAQCQQAVRAARDL